MSLAAYQYQKLQLCVIHSNGITESKIHFIDMFLLLIMPSLFVKIFFKQVEIFIPFSSPLKNGLFLPKNFIIFHQVQEILTISVCTT